MKADNYNIDDCVHCGNCKALCPTYAQSTTELMSARGRVALLQKFVRGELKVSDKLYESLFSCILCQSCSQSCPMGINITDAIYKGRKNLRSYNKNRLLFNTLIKLALKNPALFFKLLRVFKIVSDFPFADRLAPFRYIKSVGIGQEDAPFRGKITVFRAQHAHGRIAIFTGCLVNLIYPNYGRALLRILNTMGYDVILPAGEVCCGAPMLESGMEEDALKMAKINIETFKKLNLEAVIALCPTCIHFIRNVYKRLVGDCLNNVMDVSEFLNERISTLSAGKSSQTPAANSPNLKAVYHDPCHSINSLNLYNEPRNILKEAGVNLIEPVETGCCGLGGSFGLFYGELSDGMLRGRLEAYKGADVIITSCPNCIMQLKSSVKAQKVMHIVEIIEKIIVKTNV